MCHRISYHIIQPDSPCSIFMKKVLMWPMLSQPSRPSWRRGPLSPYIDFFLWPITNRVYVETFGGRPEGRTDCKTFLVCVVMYCRVRTLGATCACQWCVRVATFVFFSILNGEQTYPTQLSVKFIQNFSLREGVMLMCSVLRICFRCCTCTRKADVGLILSGSPSSKLGTSEPPVTYIEQIM